jgi:hypothetical protein
MPMPQNPIIEYLYEFAQQGESSRVEWEQPKRSFIEHIHEQGQRVQLQVSELPNHVKMRAGWFPLRGLIPSVRECVKDYFLNMNVEIDSITYTGLDNNKETLIIATHIILKGDIEDMLEEFVILRHQIINQIQQVRWQLAGIIEECSEDLNNHDE